MDTRAERLEAFVLRTHPYGERDLVVHLLVRGRGRVAAFARGARPAGKRFAGALEPFQRLEVLLHERSGQELWMLREASVVEAHPALREHLHRIAHAGYASELLHDLTRPSQPADRLFALLEEFLARLCVSEPTSALLRAFELGALDAAGLAPELSGCARCGTRVAPGRAAFDPDAGGLCCARCAHPSALALTVGARAALVQLQRRGMAGAQAPLSADGSDRPADPRAFEEAAGEAARALSAFVAHHLGRSPRSMRFSAQVGAPP
ncbi:MAG: DNA repair protein RecO [Myxococcales bacterium]